MDDTHLVCEFQRTADPTHFNALVERHRGPVFRLVLSILGPGREGEAVADPYYGGAEGFAATWADVSEAARHLAQRFA